MATTVPSIACLGVIGRNNNPLHTTIFPSYQPSNQSFEPVRTPLQFSLLLSSTLDVFEARAQARSATGSSPSPNPATTTTSTAAGTLSGDLGLLHAVDDRLAAYGFETNTGTRFVAVVDMRGRQMLDGHAPGPGGGGAAAGGAAAAVAAVGAASKGAAAAGGGQSAAAAAASALGLREGELRVVFRAMQAAYVALLQNPFYEPDEHAPLGGQGGRRITSRRFGEEMRRIGETWTPGVTSL